MQTKELIPLIEKRAFMMSKRVKNPKEKLEKIFHSLILIKIF